MSAIEIFTASLVGGVAGVSAVAFGWWTAWLGERVRNR